MRLALCTSVCLSAALCGTAVGDDAAPADEPAPALTVQFAYMGDLMEVVDGGLDEGGVYLDDLDAQIGVDLDRVFGWSGARAFVYGLYTNGNSINEKSGDLQGPSGIEVGVEGVRLVEAWIDQSFAEGAGSLRVGLYDVSGEFDAGEVRALFLNSSHGSGPDFSQTGLNGPSMWPVTSFGARLNWTFEGGPYARLAVVDGVPGDLDHPKRTTIDFDDGDGALIVGEVGIAEEGRLWSLGAWVYTEEFADLVTAETHSNRGAYVALEERLMERADDGPWFDLSGSLRLGVADSDVNPLSSFFGATLVATGLIPARADDQLGLGLALANAGDAFRTVIADAGGTPARREINIELTYYADVTEWLSVQPDLQWIIDPGADRAVDDAFVAGLRFQLKSDWAID